MSWSFSFANAKGKVIAHNTNNRLAKMPFTIFATKQFFTKNNTMSLLSFFFSTKRKCIIIPSVVWRTFPHFLHLIVITDYLSFLQYYYNILFIKNQVVKMHKISGFFLASFDTRTCKNFYALVR